MQHGVKIAIDQIEENPQYKERHSQWIDHTYGELRNVVGKVGMVRIVVKKTGKKYTVVLGHHLLKAARECGLRELYADVIDTEAEAGQRSRGEDLLVFRSAVREILRAAATSHDDTLVRHPTHLHPQADVRALRVRKKPVKSRRKRQDGEA
jgi:predicted metal-dependent phosphotriesterase family hydrolase